MGLLVNVGRVGNIRIPLLRLILRAEKGIGQKGSLHRLLEASVRLLMPNTGELYGPTESTPASQETRASPGIRGTGSSPGSPIPGPDAPGHPTG